MKEALYSQQILALNMEIKGEMLKETKLQDHKFSRSMEKFQENMYNFINILSQSMQMMSASFNPFQYRQVNHYQAPYHQQTWCSTDSKTHIFPHSAFFIQLFSHSVTLVMFLLNLKF